MIFFEEIHFFLGISLRIQNYDKKRHVLCYRRTIQRWHPALRVPHAETRLTVHRLLAMKLDGPPGGNGRKRKFA